MSKPARCILLLLLTACGAGETVDVGSSAPAVVGRELAADPRFSVSGGVFNGDSIYLYGVNGGEFLANGNAVLALGRQQNTLVVIDTAGQVVEVLGGPGDGPKEFRGTPALIRAGTRVFALDQTARRFNELLGSGLSEPTTYEPMPLQVVTGIFDDGAVIATQNTMFVASTGEQGFKEGMPVTPYYVWTASVADTLQGPASPPAAGFWLGKMGYMVPSSCKPQTRYAVRNSSLLIADASTGLVMALTRSGVVDTVYQSPERPVVSQAMVDGARRFSQKASVVSPEYVDAFLESVGNVGDPLESVWSALLWDNRNLWLRQAVPCLFGGDYTDPYTWEVIDVETRSRVAVVQVPADLRLLAVAPDRVLAVREDELGVERVGVYLLR